jgi:hypothetical protein
MGQIEAVKLAGGVQTSGISSSESVGHTFAWAMRNIPGTTSAMGSRATSLALGSNHARSG